jgi:hypothetical protein
MILVNSDTPAHTTTYGTQMTNDIHWKMMFKNLCQMHVKAILALKKEFNEIYIENLNGNHDTATSFFLVEYLSARFHQDDVVKFGDNYKETTAHLFGENLIVMNHGAIKGIPNLIANIPTVFKDFWSKATHVFFFQGHEHHVEISKEKNGILKEKLPSVSGTDEYHETRAYNTALQQQVFFVFHEVNGMVAKLFVTFPKKKLIKSLKRSV